MGYNTLAKVKPPLRTPQDVQAIKEGLKQGMALIMGDSLDTQLVTVVDSVDVVNADVIRAEICLDVSDGRPLISN